VNMFGIKPTAPGLNGRIMFNKAQECPITFKNVPPGSFSFTGVLDQFYFDNEHSFKFSIRSFVHLVSTFNATTSVSSLSLE
jgi:hypothetical protein